MFEEFKTAKTAFTFSSEFDHFKDQRDRTAMQVLPSHLNDAETIINVCFSLTGQDGQRGSDGAPGCVLHILPPLFFLLNN